MLQGLPGVYLGSWLDQEKGRGINISFVFLAIHSSFLFLLGLLSTDTPCQDPCSSLLPSLEEQSPFPNKAPLLPTSSSIQINHQPERQPSGETGL